MADATLTTLGTAAITAALGYSAAHLQYRGSRETIAAEDRRRDGDRAEALRQTRQTAYQEFLNTVFSFPLMAKGYRDVDGNVLHQWYEEFQNRSHAVMLVGSRQVIERANETDGVLLEVLKAYKESEGSASARLSRALKPHDADLHSAYTALQEAMRADVGAPSASADMSRELEAETA